MTTFIAILLTISTIAFVAYPLFKQKLRFPARLSVKDTDLRELLSTRDTTYSMLKELEFDFQSGILSEADYRDLETRYKGKAISILKDIDSLAESGNAEDEIEKQILARRQQKRPSVPNADDEIEKQVLALRQQKKTTKPNDDEIERRVTGLRQAEGQFCPQCGSWHQKGDRFCIQCGTKLTREKSG